tara:strand:+ start:2293 stop:2568 length:276 start_codon:yes stop_codon:yes gene_type:complete
MKPLAKKPPKKPIKMLNRVRVTEPGHFYEDLEGIAVEQVTDESVYLIEIDTLPQNWSACSAYIHGDALTVIPHRARKKKATRKKVKTNEQS